MDWAESGLQAEVADAEVTKPKAKIRWPPILAQWLEQKIPVFH